MNNKFYLLAVTLLLHLTSTLAQTPNFLMVKREGSSNDDFGNCIHKDANGDIIFAGWFAGTITIGATTLTSAGYADILLVKYDPLGNLIWARREGGTNMDVPYSLSTDLNGNILITGYFTSPTLTFGATTLVHSALSDMFVAKFDSLGNPIWARGAGGTDAEVGSRVNTDANGNVFVVGSYFSPTLTFDTITITNTAYNDMYLAKYDPIGNILWVQTGNGFGSEYGTDIEPDQDGNLLVTGSFDGFSMTMDSTIFISNGNSDAYLAKFDTDGNLIWHRTLGGLITEGAHNVEVDNDNNAYITGYTTSDTVVVGSSVLINSGSLDIFLVKYDENGNVIWARIDGGTGGEQAFNLVLDNSGGIVLVAGFNGSSNFGTIPITAFGGQDIVYAKYDTSGNVLWAFGVGGTDNEQCKSIDFDAFGNLITTGTFRSPAITFGSTTLVNAGTTTNDIFIFSVDVLSGMTEGFVNQQVNVFPNPFSTQAIIQTNRIFHNARLCIYNAFGQIVKELEIGDGNTVTIDRENLSNGVYFAQLVENGKIIATEKLVIGE